jgi:hypothetical protein
MTKQASFTWHETPKGSVATKRVGRPPRNGVAADDVVRVRVTEGERAKLHELARARGVTPSELVREWIAGGPTRAPEVPTEPPYFVARNVDTAEPKFKGCFARWMPKHVWTLHAVPGRRGGEPIAVRRRVLSIDEDHYFQVESPSGLRIGFSGDDLGPTGVVRSGGRSHFDDRKPPRFAGQFWGLEAAIWIYDHNPTAAERDEWLTRHVREQALIMKPPTHVWVQLPGARDAAPDIVKRWKVEKLAANGDCVGRFGFELEVPDRPDRPGALFHGLDLAAGSTETWINGRYRVHLERPSAEYLAAAGLERARERAEAERARAKAEASFASFRFVNVNAEESPGVQACRALGLDPNTATAAEVDAAFRSKAKTAHPDAGGSTEAFIELTKQRDAAREHVASRGVS